MATIGLADVLLISPLIALFLASLIPITTKIFNGNVEQPAIVTLIEGLGGLIVAWILLLVISGSGKPTLAFSNALVVDGMTTWMASIALICAGVALALMYDNPATSGEQFSELVFLTLASTIGMVILASAQDFLVVFVGLETMSLSLYLMIGMSHEERLAKESAMKYFVLGSFASAIFLYGVAMVFATAGGTSLATIMEKMPTLIGENRLFLFGVVLLSIGFCFKVSIAPFHAWTPDVYQGAPTPHAAFMATAVKTVSFAAFLRFVSLRALVGSENLFDFLQWLAVITMIVGNVAAILQNNFKRMLAYSSVAHSGYILVGLITAGVSDNVSFGASGVIFYLFAYSLMTLGAFAIVCLFEKSENTIVNISDLNGLAKKRPVMAFCLTLFLLSLAGIPPTIGFFGKFYLFTTAIGEGLIWLALWGVINSVISVYYYLRPIVAMYMQDGEADHAPRTLSATKLAVVGAAFLVVALGLASGSIFQAVERSLL